MILIRGIRILFGGWFGKRPGMIVNQIEWIVALLLVVVAIGVFANWLKIAYPILLVLGGLLLSVQDGAPKFELPPSVVFLIFLPPLLYAAAFNTEWLDFRTQLRSIGLLAVGLVVATTAAVTFVCHYYLDLPWTVGFLLGAIIAPPDAVAAAAITKRVRIPRIVSTILEGESLVNDASALVAYRIAIGAVAYGGFAWADAGREFFVAGLGGIAIGLIGAWCVVALHRRLDRSGLADNKLQIAITLLTPYAVYLPAEHFHFSGVLAAVAAGLWVGTRCSRTFSKEFYHEARAVWEMLEFLLNGVIFILIGFQLPVILENLGSDRSLEYLIWASVILSAVVIAVRILWVFPGAYLPRYFDQMAFGKRDPYPPWQSVSVVAWTGMRGVVSLAAAMAIPLKTKTGEAFPHRDLIQFFTFWVIFSTLVLQGLTLPFLIRFLRVERFVEPDDSPNEEREGSC